MNYRAFCAAIFVLIAGICAAHAFGLGFGHLGALKNSSIMRSSYSGPANVVASPVNFWGLRAVSTAYASSHGKLVNITRASDSHACDVLSSSSTGGFGLTGNCGTGADNGQSAASFCTSTTCSIATFYDQSGTSNLTATAVSLNLSCLNGLPCAVFNGSTSFASDSTTTQAQPLTISAVAERTGAFTSYGQILDSNTNDYGLTFSTSANSIFCYGGSVVNVSALDNAPHAIQCVMTGTTTSSAVIDGTATTGNFGTSSLGGTLQIGRGLNNLTGNIWEIGLWGSAFNSTQYANMTTNQQTYWGFSSNCPQGLALADGCTGAQASGVKPYPNLATPGILTAVAIRTGSGYTTGGPYSWTATGGGCAVEPAGTVTVTGGNLGGSAGLSYTITTAGSGCTSRPTIAIPAGAGAGSNGAMVAVLYTSTPHNQATPYNVPGVDYPVGYDRTLSLKDPTVQGNLPSGATVSGSTVTISGNNVTLNGYDFCSHSASLTINASVTGYSVTNNKFCNPVANGQNITLNNSTSGVVKYNDFNGGAVLGGNGSTAAQGCGSNCGPNGALCCGGPTSLTFEYNYCYQQDSKCFQVNGTSSGAVIEKYNLYDTLGNCATGTGNPCAHGETEYSFGSGTLNQTVSFNAYWNPFHCTQQGGDTAGCPNGNPGNLTAIAALQADTLSINGTTFDHNFILQPGPGTPCAVSNAFAYTGQAAIFDGAQGGGTITNVAENANIIDASGAQITWYHTSLGSGVTTTNNITAVGGGACN